MLPHVETFEFPPLGGAEAFRAVVKIAVGYYLHLGGSLGQIREAIDIIVTEALPPVSRVGLLYAIARSSAGNGQRLERRQVEALGRLDWSVRRIEREAQVRRETASAYLKAAGIEVRGHAAPGQNRPLRAR